MIKMNEKYYISEYDTPVGKVYMAADDIGLVGLWIDGQLHFAKILGGVKAVERVNTRDMADDGEVASDESRDMAGAEPGGGEAGGRTCTNSGEVSKLTVFEQTRNWLDIYFEGREPDFMPPLHLIGTDFRKEVWKILLQIPYGQTVTYGEIAEELAKSRGIRRMSAQAVGGAVGHNNISIIVPCHRVIGADGSLTGYAGGMEIKARLLWLEGVQWKE